MIDVGQTLADHDFRADELLAATPRERPWNPKRPPSPQTSDQFPPQCTAALHVQRLVDGLVGDPHRIILGEIDPEPVSDLLRTPRARPASLLPPTVVPAGPAHIWARHARPVSGGDDACKSVLHILAQFVVHGELRDLRTPGASVGVPLGTCGSILQVATTGHSVPTQLEAETEPSVRVVLGHFIFVYIHPYLDGNGRMGRFFMNVMLASGGYPWTIIPVERREDECCGFRSPDDRAWMP